ncbi:MAG: hypothetical protein AABY01_04980, partial [Nanoarchaeota archaeon]
MRFFTGTREEQLALLRGLPARERPGSFDRIVNAFNASQFSGRLGFDRLIQEGDRDFVESLGTARQTIQENQVALANILASSGNAAEDAFNLASPQVAQRRAEIVAQQGVIQSYQTWFPQASIEGAVPAPVQDARGNFVLASEAQQSGRQDTPVSQQRAQQANMVIQQADGTFAIMDAQGNVFEGGFANEQAALARQTQFVSGGTPGLTGQPTVFGTTPVNPQEQATVESGQASVATPEQLQ